MLKYTKHSELVPRLPLKWIVDQIFPLQFPLPSSILSDFSKGAFKALVGSRQKSYVIYGDYLGERQLRDFFTSVLLIYSVESHNTEIKSVTRIKPLMSNARRITRKVRLYVTRNGIMYSIKCVRSYALARALSKKIQVRVKRLGFVKNKMKNIYLQDFRRFAHSVNSKRDKLLKEIGKLCVLRFVLVYFQVYSYLCSSVSYPAWGVLK